MTTVFPNNLILRLNCIRSRIVPSRYSPQISKLPVFDIFAVSSRSVTTTSEPFYGRPREGKKPLSPLQSISLAVYSATNAFLDPERHDMVAALAEVTGSVALHTMHRDMMNDPTGRRILADRPLVNTNSIDIQALEGLPKNTFGYAYAMFLRKNGFDPDERAHVKYIANEELAYVMKRYRQCHDFYHVVTDLPPTVLGELALKYVELFQTGLPVCALSVSVGSMKLSKDERRQLVEEYLPWAIRVGKNNKKWINIYWEEEFQKDLKDFRLELGIDVAPMM